MNFNFPFSYYWLIKKNIDKVHIKTILDLGCGKGEFGDLINNHHKYEITGVDIFNPYLNICRKKRKYIKLIKGDLTKKINFEPHSFDAVVCLQTIEHMKKIYGLSLLEQIERIAKKLFIISTPVGECLQEVYDKNKHQRHLSSWDPTEFYNRGYKVFGTGLKLVYGPESHVKQGISLKKLPLYLLSFLMNPIANIFPKIASQMVAIKIRER